MTDYSATMKAGWMWHDADPKTTVEEKVAKAVVAYHRRHGCKPTVCYLNEKHKCLSPIGPVKVVHVSNLLLDHFWLEEGRGDDPR